MTDTETDDLPLLADTEPAMKRAAIQARRVAAQNGIPLAIWRDGKVVFIGPEDEGSNTISWDSDKSTRRESPPIL